MKTEVRKAQQVGYSTLIVSLPKEWVNESGLKRGDLVSMVREDDGSLRLRVGMPKELETPVRCIVNADKCVEPGLLTRVITGTYIIGHEAIEIASETEVSQQHLNEIRAITRRLTGITTVERTFRKVTLQNLVDPTGFPVDGLLRRLYVITSSMQEATIRALKERRSDLADEVANMEEEADSIYWLVVRQLLLAARNRNVAKSIGVASPLHIVGSRLVAKMLEKIGDYSEGMAKEVRRMLDLKALPDKETIEDTSELFEVVRSVYDATMQALFTKDADLANQAIELSRSAEKDESKLTEKIFAKVQEIGKKSKDTASDMGALMAIRIVAWNLGQIADHCSTIAEITINRTLEDPSEVCKFEKA